MRALTVLVVLLSYTTPTTPPYAYILHSDLFQYSALTDSLHHARSPHTHQTSHRCSRRNQSSGAADSRGILQDLQHGLRYHEQSPSHHHCPSALPKPRALLHGGQVRSQSKRSVLPSLLPSSLPSPDRLFVHLTACLS